MSDDPAIIEAAIRALRDSLGPAPLPKTHWQTHWELKELTEIILTAVTPLIRAGALEEAASMAEARQRLYDDPRKRIAIRETAAAIRSLKEVK